MTIPPILEDYVVASGKREPFPGPEYNYARDCKDSSSVLYSLIQYLKQNKLRIILATLAISLSTFQMVDYTKTTVRLDAIQNSPEYCQLVQTEYNAITRWPTLLVIGRHMALQEHLCKTKPPQQIKIKPLF